MKQVHHQTGNLFSPPSLPRRIISIVPSQTEFLYDLGLTDEVIGITKFCVHPAQWFQSKTRIGGTKQLNLPLIESLKPDLVIGSKEENVKEQVEAIAAFCPVWCSDIATLADAYEMMATIGSLTGKKGSAAEIIQTIQNEFASLPKTNISVKAAYLIWQKPYMTVGGDTFIHTMMEAAGFENVFAHHARYPVISMQELINAQADVVLFSSEPFPFKEKHLHLFANEWQTVNPSMPHLKIVDGELFSWYGSRLIHAANYFRKLKESLFLNDEFTV
ncbi:ABC transporter substrate-binding protein [Lacibacter sp. H407]|uniref:ABC transporter substrate-binding protein n=1 Tax=Lacibacter sp. H407 TaxID=3133423 RepID=UPI0030C01874